MDEFESLLETHINAVARLIRFKIPIRTDADDILQEVCLTAYQNFPTLRDKSAFKPWLLRIARNKCNDYFREKARCMELPLEYVTQPSRGRWGITSVVRETLEQLADREKQILYLFYFRELPQAEIAQRLNIPLGTVKSRLHSARESFKKYYPYPPKKKGELSMKQLPQYIPDYKIEPIQKEAFPVCCEEIIGWMLVPKLDEKICWAMYDFPEKRRTELCEMQVTGRAEVHGIEGVEIIAKEYDPMECNAIEGQSPVERRFIAQLTETHCRLLAESHVENGVRKYYTFLDDDAFLRNWGFGENNCGNETHLAPKQKIVRSGNVIHHTQQPDLLDVVGRYSVTIAGKVYDTICVMDIETYNEGMATEQYIDRNGRTVLWRRFNRDDWAYDRYRQLWSEKLPDNERITINGQRYVHWYDCISDYIL